MAREFPHCEVLGIDLAPVPLLSENLPPNCRFELDDVSLGLGHLQDQFDIVFARLMGMGLKDFRKTLSDAEGCLRPGGIVIWIEPDFDFYSGWPAVYRPFWSSQNPNGSYIIRLGYGGLRLNQNFQTDNPIEVRRISTNDVRTLEKVLDEGYWTCSTVLDPNTYVPLEDKDNR
jgi:SAM-dependent methyltransferase